MKSQIITLLLAIIAGSISAIVTAANLNREKEMTAEDRIKEFYLTETAVHVSPHHIRKAMSKGEKNFVLVDLRSQAEYEKEHVVGAVNIPAYKDPNTSAYGDVERIVGEFSNLPQDRDIIVYCYSIPCMTGRKVGKILAEHGIYVKHLGVGWNEWRYFWNLWNHEHEWDQINVEDFVISGYEPGEPKIMELPTDGCSEDSAFGC